MTEGVIMELVYFVRVLIAGICGIIIGYERKSRAKEAGIRTHCIVACAAALMMIVSKYGFFDLIAEAIHEGVEVKLDPSRIASCIVSGVGFLGAGMIFVQKQTIKGLTTAAGIWATAGIGMAIGSGLYVIGVMVALLIVFAQYILHKDSKILEVPHFKLVRIANVDRIGLVSELTDKFAEMNIAVDDVEISRNSENNCFNYILTLEVPKNSDDEAILMNINYDASIENIR